MFSGILFIANERFFKSLSTDNALPSERSRIHGCREINMNTKNNPLPFFSLIATG